MRLQMVTIPAILFSVFLVFACACPPTVGLAETTDDPASKVAQDHPLRRLVELATQREALIREQVRDYSCRIVKKEWIGGAMQKYRYIDTKVRLGHKVNGQSKPLAIYLKFLGPKDIAGRTVVYQDGQNDGQMVVRRGGQRLGDVVRSIDPESDLARKESLVDIRHMGVANMVSEIVKHLHEDMNADPTGENTKLEIFRNAKINGQSCTHIRISHPERAEKLKIHLVNIYVDDSFHLPIRIEAYGWPLSDGKDPPLLAEFTYTDIKVNVGLTDRDFDPDRLRTARRR